MSASPWDIRSMIAARVAELTPASSYQQAATDAWREAIDPMLDGEPSPRAHLSFWVEDGRINQSGSHRANASEGAHVVGEVDVIFLYRLRPKAESADWDRSTKAAMAVAKTLLDPDPKDWTAFDAPNPNPDFTVQAAPTLIERDAAGTAEVPFARVRVGLNVIYQLSLDE